MSKSRAKLFIENFFAYGVINALNKFVPLLLLPVITRLLTDTSEFGRFDMFNTIVSLGTSIAILGMYDALFREYFERDDQKYKKAVTSTALVIVSVSSVLITIILIVFNKAFSQLFIGDQKSGYIILMSAIGILLSANTNIISAPTRIQNKRKIYVFSGLLNILSYYILAIVLLNLGYGYKGLIFSNLVATVLLVVFFFILNRKEFDILLFDKKIAKELFKIGLPLLPTFIIYWMFHAIAKIMITNMMGLSDVGIYSIGSKVASISLFIYSAFAGGWQYFSFSTMKDKDQVQMNSRIFEYLAAISFFAYFLSMNFDNLVFNSIFTGDYKLGVIVFPFLFLCPLLLMLFQTIGNQFLIIKKSFILTICLFIGLLTNLLLNFSFIRLFGIKGSAMATLIGYTVALLMVLIFAGRFKLLKINPRFIYLAIFTCIVTVKLFFFDDVWTTVFTLIGMLMIIIFYYKDFKLITRLIPYRFKRNKE